MHRLYLHQVTSDLIQLDDPEQLHHLKNVQRVRAGEEVYVFDAQGSEYRCRVEKILPDSAVLRVEAKTAMPSRRTSLTIACAIPKKSGMDDIIENLTELDVDAIIPMETERVVVRLDEAKKTERLERWKRIARNASEQSQRAVLPDIFPITGFAQVVAQSGQFGLKLIPTLLGDRKPLREVIAADESRKILALIGPEGDFTPGEVSLAESAGFVPVSLGKRVLRVGMAAVVVAGFITLAGTGD